ncbi:MAG: hypothetical protein ACRC0F_03700 [Cetobacterium sp.]
MKVTKNFTQINKLDRTLKYIQAHKVSIGILGQELSDDGVITIVKIAEINEYGTDGIPARPFFREATQYGESPTLIKKRINNIIKNIIALKIEGRPALQNVGMYIKGRIQKSIKSGNWTPNSEATKKKKKKKKGGYKPPLIDTGSMLRAIDFEIKRK